MCKTLRIKKNIKTLLPCLLHLKVGLFIRCHAETCFLCYLQRYRLKLNNHVAHKPTGHVLTVASSQKDGWLIQQTLSWHASLTYLSLFDAGYIKGMLEGLKIEFELSASDANVSILSRNRWQPIIAKPPAGGGFF